MSSISASSPRSLSRSAALSALSFSSRAESSLRRRFAAPYGTLLDGKRLLALFGEGAAGALDAAVAGGMSATTGAGDASPEDGVDGDGDGGEFILVYVWQVVDSGKGN